MKRNLPSVAAMAVTAGMPGLFQGAWGQACPACSNPALQSSQRVEVDGGSLPPGTFRASLHATGGSDYQGGHPNWKGLSENGRVTDVPLHHHVVSLDFVRTELALEHTFAENWTAWLRIPYDVKIQTASIDFEEAVTEEEKQAILRNRDLHHRKETYTGSGDLRLLLSRRLAGLMRTGDRLDLAFGLSLPLGKTEEDPIAAGNRGERHLHIQFGTGTFDPLLEAHYAFPIGSKAFISFYSISRLPFYSNSKGYTWPLETTTGLA